MKLKIDDKILLDINDTMLKILANDLPSEEVVAEIERRVVWIITHKLDECYKRLAGEWTPRLAQRNIEFIPTDREKYAQLVFSQPDYKNRSERANNVD